MFTTTATWLRRFVCLFVLGCFVVNPLAVWAGASVNIQDGLFIYNTVDLSSGGLHPLVLQRHYQTLRPKTRPTTEPPEAPVKGPFGYGTSLGMLSMRAWIDYDSQMYIFPGLAGPTGDTTVSLTGEQVLFTRGDYYVAPNEFRNTKRTDSLRGIVNRAVDKLSMTLSLESGTKLFFTRTAALGQDGRLEYYGLRTITDRFGKVTTLEFDSSQRLVKVIDPFGRYITFSYSSNTSYVIARAELFDDEDVSHGFVQYGYDSQENHLTSFKNVMHNQQVETAIPGVDRIVNGETLYTYDNSSKHRMLSIKNPRGIVALTNTYNTTSGRITSQIMPGEDATKTAESNIIKYFSYPSGSITQVQDTAGTATTYYYDSMKKYLTRATHGADGSSTGYEYNPTTQLLTSTTNPLGQRTENTYTYDNTYDHLASTTYPDTTTVTYDFSAPFGQLKQVTNANNHTTYFNYFPDVANQDYSQDFYGSLQFSKIQLDAQTTLSDSWTQYNSFSQVLRTQDGKNRQTTFEYYTGQALTGCLNEQGYPYQDLKSTLAPSNIKVCFTYDGLSRPITSYNPKFPNDKTTYTYDNLGRVTYVVQPGNRTTRYTYDDNSNTTSVTAANGVKTTYTYNDQDQVETRTEADFSEEYHYNNLGLVSSYRDKRGQLTQYSYDTKQRLKIVNYSGLSSQTYDYNLLDQITKISDSRGSAYSVAMVYNTAPNQMPRLKQTITNPDSIEKDTLEYSYDNVGNVTKVTRVTATTRTDLLQYTYLDDDASLSRIALKGGGPDLVMSFKYNAAGDLEQVLYPNMTGQVNYNPAGGVRDLTFTTAAGTFRKLSYTWDYDQRTDGTAKGYLVSRTETSPSAPASVPTLMGNQKYSYNNVGELTCVQTATIGCPSTGAGTFTTSYDSDGNATSLNTNGVTTTLTYDQPTTNRLTKYGKTTILTDPNGNITDDGVNTYTWNERDELVSLRNKSTGAVASFSYDALGRRISKTIGGVTTSFVYSGSQVIEETTNGVTRRYLVGLGLDSVFASRTGTTNAQDEVYLKDALNGSVLAAVTTEANPRVKTGYGYTPFGQVTRYPSSWQQVGTGDFTQDGKTDILVSNYATGENALWRMNGTAYHSALTLKPESDRNWRSAAVGDFNQDGKPDIVKHNEATGANAIWLMQGTTYEGATPLPSTEDRNWRPVATGDFDRDGSTDIVMSNYQTGENALWLMRGTAYTGGVNLPSVGSDLNWRVIATGDFSLEGQVDLLLTNYATGQNAVWIMNGVTYSGNAATLPLDYEADWRSTTTGDFDQDGQPDIVKSNYATGENAIWLMDGFAYQGAGPLPTYTNFYTNPAASTNNLTFTGREDDGTGVLYYRARYYSPRLQRFISEDPIGFGGGDTNLYRYVGNAPTIKSDPVGLWGITLSWGTQGLLGNGAAGGAYQGSVGFGIFGGGDKGINIGGFHSVSGLLGGPYGGINVPIVDSKGTLGTSTNGNFAIGGFYSPIGGPGVTITNTTDAETYANQIQKTLSATFGLGVNASAQYSYGSNGLWALGAGTATGVGAGVTNIGSQGGGVTIFEGNKFVEALNNTVNSFAGRFVYPYPGLSSTSVSYGGNVSSGSYQGTGNFYTDPQFTYTTNSTSATFEELPAS